MITYSMENEFILEGIPNPVNNYYREDYYYIWHYSRLRTMYIMLTKKYDRYQL